MDVGFGLPAAVSRLLQVTLVWHVRYVVRDVPSAAQDDIAGLMEEVKLRLRAALEWPGVYNAMTRWLGMRASRGLLGCRKTTLMRGATAAGGSLVISQTLAHIYQCCMSEAESLVRLVFAETRVRATPCYSRRGERDCCRARWQGRHLRGSSRAAHRAHRDGWYSERVTIRFGILIQRNLPGMCGVVSAVVELNIARVLGDADELIAGCQEDRYDAPHGAFERMDVPTFSRGRNTRMVTSMGSVAPMR